MKKLKAAEGIHGLLEVVQLAVQGAESRSPDSTFPSVLKNAVLFWSREL